MAIDREQQWKDLVAEFPDSPMGHFSLGKLYFDGQRYAEAAACLERATRLDPDYAAALVALGDAYARQGDAGRAREAYGKAKGTPLAQKDRSLLADVLRRIEEL
ncbi:MAG: tetratricopeptide repeat protein [Myxococcaceae bacterium]